MFTFLSAVCLQFFTITGLCVSDQYLIAQYHIEGGIDVYDRVTLKHLYRLNGHEYGGQCVEISGTLTLFTFCQLFVYNFIDFSGKILYSASMDFTLKVWNLETQKMTDTASDHCDYVQCLAIKPG